MEYLTIGNRLKLPQIGLGTWQMTDREQVAEVLSSAYDEGYRLIDTAAAYCNEIAIAKAIADRSINRAELFISDKVWNTSRGYEAVQEACRKSLKKLKTDYMDLYLIHWPASMKLYPNWAEINADTWRGMEQLYTDGLVKAIGVCNFKTHHLEELKKTANVKPMINQVEMHPGLNQSELVEYCHTEDIAIEASSPLGSGQVLHNDELLAIAKKKEKTVAQICLRWGIQKGVIVIPKTTNVERIRQNIDVFNFELDADEMSTIDAIPYCGGIGIDSDEVIEFG